MSSIFGLFSDDEPAPEECEHSLEEDEVPVRRGSPLPDGSRPLITAWATCEKCGADLRLHQKRGWILDDGWLSDD